MKKTAVVLMGATLLVTALAFNADALTISFGDEYYVGMIQPSIPSGTDSEVDYINFLIDLGTGVEVFRAVPDDPSTTVDDQYYLRSNLDMSGAEDVVLVGAYKDEEAPLNITTEFLYILAKYGGGGESGGGSLVWYLGGYAGGAEAVTVPATYFDRGVSHVSGYNSNSVPDGGGTLVLLGCAFGVLGMFKRLV